MKRYIISFFIALMCLLIGTSLAAAQEPEDQPLVIVVRDGVGNPLSGISLTLLLSGPPHEPFDTCLTDESGQCSLLLAAGAYLVQFEGGWQGTEFVPISEQNDGALNDGGSAGGGFGVYIELGEAPEPLTFVIGQQDGYLVPLWDMSRSAEETPRPFAVPDSPFDEQSDALAEIDLGSLLDPTAKPNEAENGPQVVEEAINPGLQPTATAVLIEPSDPAETPGGTTRSVVIQLIVLLVIMFGAAGFVIIRLLQKAPGQEK